MWRISATVDLSNLDSFGHILLLSAGGAWHGLGKTYRGAKLPIRMDTPKNVFDAIKGTKATTSATTASLKLTDLLFPNRRRNLKKTFTNSTMPNAIPINLIWQISGVRNKENLVNSGFWCFYYEKWRQQSKHPNLVNKFRPLQRVN